MSTSLSYVNVIVIYQRLYHPSTSSSSYVNVIVITCQRSNLGALSRCIVKTGANFGAIDISRVERRNQKHIERFLFRLIEPKLPHLKNRPPPTGLRVPSRPRKIENRAQPRHILVQVLFHWPVLLASTVNVTERVEIRKNVNPCLLQNSYQNGQLHVLVKNIFQTIVLWEGLEAVDANQVILDVEFESQDGGG